MWTHYTKNTSVPKEQSPMRTSFYVLISMHLEDISIYE